MTVNRVATAPVSYGVFGNHTVGPGSGQLLQLAAAAGFDGCELGPPGFFGSAQETAAAFRENGLQSPGAYVPLHLTMDDQRLQADLEAMDRTCEELAACGGGLAILADEGSPELLANPARPWDDRTLALDSDQWRRLARRVDVAKSRAEAHGLDVSFHPHISTFVESPWEVERLLDLTDVALTFDMGHVRLAGGDPVVCAAAWASRINHVHVKDVDVSVIEQARRDRRTDFDDWWGGVSTALGAGDVDVPAVLSVFQGVGYSGWYVIEQDHAASSSTDYVQLAAEQASNLTWLTSLLVAAGAGAS
jgi:inosose dehydratase